MKTLIFTALFLLGGIVLGQTTQKVELKGVDKPIYFKFRNDYTQVRMFAQGEEATSYLDITSSYIEDGCIFIYIEDTNGEELLFVKCEDNSIALRMADGKIYEGGVIGVTHH